ncbi:hypothetical protein [Hydrogenophilus thiooxidans]|uniref:hypothetical protein n=1 Tax=Hydrogenophilus thiooxidans TaxID=2820326 RepID=UPI001C22C77A|nr:hypothetical protein [Hydrogenophilus thiooxidans]
MKLRSLLLLIAAAVLVLQIVVAVVSWNVLDRSIHHFSVVRTVVMPNTKALDDALLIGVQVQAAMRLLVFEPNDALASERMLASMRQFPDALKPVLETARREKVRQLVQQMIHDWE